jgi:predicted GNAT family N-acyltransferase
MNVEEGTPQRTFTVRRADWHNDRDRDQLMVVRRDVFVVGQNVSEEMELDGLDPQQAHFLAEDSAGNPIGTARLADSGKVGRVAVLENWRGRNVGLAIMQAVIANAESRGMTQLYLHGQTWTVPFYEKLGFVVDETVDEFLEADIPHRRMVRVSG